MNKLLTPQLLTSIFRYGSVALVALLFTIGLGYSNGESSQQVVGELVKVLGPILGGAVGWGGFDGYRASQVKGGHLSAVSDADVAAPLVKPNV